MATQSNTPQSSAAAPLHARRFHESPVTVRLLHQGIPLSSVLLSPADSSSATPSRLGSLSSFFRNRREKAAQDSAAARAKALETAARLQEWKSHGFAFEVRVPKTTGQKLGLRLKDKNLEVIGFPCWCWIHRGL